MLLKEKCVGSLNGVLHIDDKVIVTSDKVFKVKFSRRFENWLAKGNLVSRNTATYVVLPKTLKEEPFLIFEVLGISQTAKFKDEVNVVGTCIYENKNNECVLIRVCKDENKQFVFKLHGNLNSDRDGVGKVWTIKGRRKGAGYDIVESYVG